MWICAIETSSKHGEVALLDPEGGAFCRSFEGELAHAKGLFPALESLLGSRGLEPKDLDLFVVDYGPGSYTGIRVGVAAGKMLAFALGKPVLPVDSLEVLVRNVEEAGIRTAAPVLDAKLGQVYGGAFRTGSFEPILSDFVGTAEELASLLPPDAIVFGDGAVRYRGAFKRFSLGRERWARPRAETVARLGLEAWRAGKRVEALDLVPLYLRLSVAEEKLKRRNRNAR